MRSSQTDSVMRLFSSSIGRVYATACMPVGMMVIDFNPFEDFIVFADDDNLFNEFDATVRFITHRLDLIRGLTYGEEYKAIGRDNAGMFFVKDDSACCYFYDPSDFHILEDPRGILIRRSVYCSYYGGDDEVRKY